MPLSADDTAVPALIPLPVSVDVTGGTFTLTSSTKIVAGPDAAVIGQYLADHLNTATGYNLTVSDADSDNAITLKLAPLDRLGKEGYDLTVAETGVTISALEPAGLFYGVQTLRQLFPPTIESSMVEDGPWTIPTVHITDTPRFEWRSAMLDVSRHFFSVDDVKRYIDLLSAYKINRLHLHLSDDQGWRIEIKSWPNLTAYGSTTEVGGGEGGFYTQEDYAEIVTYAQERFIIIIPEIDMPGHTNAALASYPELNCDNVAPQLYTGTEVGFSSLCFSKPETFTFIEDVIRELAEITPGPYLHIGGDEAAATPKEEYVPFIERVQTIVQKYGKQAIGWEEVTQSELLTGTIVQHWSSKAHPTEAVEQGAQLIMSPASKAYLDMKYSAGSPLGLSWAGLVSVEAAYSWDPATEVEGVTDEHIIGIEAPLWSETLETFDDIEYMAFPRLLGMAEIGWTRADARSWDEYKTRLAAHGPRLTALGINFYAAPGVEWEK